MNCQEAQLTDLMWNRMGVGWRVVYTPQHELMNVEASCVDGNGDGCYQWDEEVGYWYATVMENVDEMLYYTMTLGEECTAVLSRDYVRVHWP